MPCHVDVLDRVTTAGRPCYLKEDLATDVQTHFGSMLAGLQVSAGMEDVDVAEVMPSSVEMSERNGGVTPTLVA